jgi:hypothetical protein
MFNPQVGRLLRKALVLAVLLASLTVVNTDSGLRRVAAQATCCQNCGFAYATCLNACLDQYSCNTCHARYFACRNQCSPPCS